jgi:hypothetical protein
MLLSRLLERRVPAGPPGSLMLYFTTGGLLSMATPLAALLPRACQ